MRWNAGEDVIDGPGTIGFDAAAILMVPKATYPRAAFIFLAGMSQGVASDIGTKVNRWAAETYPIAQKHLDTARTLENTIKKRSTN